MLDSWTRNLSWFPIIHKSDSRLAPFTLQFPFRGFLLDYFVSIIITLLKYYQWSWFRLNCKLSLSQNRKTRCSNKAKFTINTRPRWWALTDLQRQWSSSEYHLEKRWRPNKRKCNHSFAIGWDNKSSDYCKGCEGRQW